MQGYSIPIGNTLEIAQSLLIYTIVFVQFMHSFNEWGVSFKMQLQGHVKLMPISSLTTSHIQTESVLFSGSRFFNNHKNLT